LPGWWAGINDNRGQEPCIDKERWHQELLGAGFTGIDSFIYDNVLNANIIARLAIERETPKVVTVLYRSSISKRVHLLERSLERRGYLLDFCTLDKKPRPGQDILCMIDFDRPFFACADSTDIELFKTFMRDLEGSRILWLTGAAQVQCTDPNYGLTLGMTRTIRNELHVNIASLELDSFEQQDWGKVVDVLNEYSRSETEVDRDPVTEYALVDEMVLVGKFHWIKIRDELRQAVQPHLPTKLVVDTPGSLQTMNWMQYELGPEQEGYVLVDVKAVGLNFKVSQRPRISQSLLSIIRILLLLWV